ncbi:MAG: Tim44/TimA family putative adaptor protein [Alphaproteobacteria bacterium]|nr:Tim44/TimA family putative adaptor protein [Alphaproteobacteria bacterium]
MIDIVIYAVIALVLVARLWATLGQRGEDDPQRPNPFARPAPPPDKPKQRDENVIMLPDRNKSSEPPVILPLGAYTASAPPNSLAGGLDQIKLLDPSFDEKGFIQGAKIAFTMIVEDFAKSDLSRIERLLAPNVLYSFQQAIALRKETGEILETVIKEIKDAEVVAAKAKDSTAILTVKFISRQTNIARDAAGQILSGSQDQIEEIHDLWTFSRDAKSADPNWQLVETKS